MEILHKLTNFFRKNYQDRFKRYLIISLIILGIILLFIGSKPEPNTSDGFKVHFFYFPDCSHCEEQYPFNEKLVDTYPSINFISHDLTQPNESTFLSEMLTNAGIEDEQTVFPITILGDQTVFIGWEAEETTGKEIETALQECLRGNCPETGSQEPNDEATIPIIGKIRISDYSLPSLAVILGLVDGFNPCAMWVLAYLISLIVTLKDRRKTWLLVGSFVFASGVLYFLFMTAWLNAFLLIGYVRPVTILIGLVALGAGILNIREFIITKGAIFCEIQDAESQKKTMSRIKRLVFSPITLATIAGIIALAFMVNSIEFVCSSALPAIFTHVLTVSNLSTLQYYAYILLYDAFFMLDDLIIFGAAALTMNAGWGTRYAKYGKPVAGTILLALGGLLLFAPHLLR